MTKFKQHAAFQLVQSMSAPEKAYFKKFAFKRVNKNNSSFTVLFDCLDKQKEFNLSKIKGKKGINSSHQSNLNGALNRLFKIVCKVLIDYRNNQWDDQKMFHLLSEYYLLKEKNLLDLAEKKYKQLEQFVESKKMYQFIPYIYQIKGNELKNSTLTSIEQLEMYFSKLDRSKIDLDIYIAINKLSLKLTQVTQLNGGIVKKSEATDKEADELLKFTNEAASKAIHNFRFSSILANSRFIIQMTFGRLENLEEYMENYLNYFDENIQQVENDIELRNISTILRNYAQVCVYFNLQELFLQNFERLQLIFAKNEDEKIKKQALFRLEHLKFLNFSLNNIKNGELSDIQIFLNYIHDTFKNKALYSEAILACMMSLVRLGKLEKALEISDNFVHSQHNERIRDQYLSIRLMRAIIWFKKEVYELYYSEIISMYRKLLKEDTFPLQFYIIQELKKLSQTTSKTVKEKAINKIIDNCSSVLANDTGTNMMKAVELRTIAMLALI